jgi:hypothetical protein
MIFLTYTMLTPSSRDCCPLQAMKTLRRRLVSAAVRRFVQCAQRALPRDGTADELLARRLVARLARLERRFEDP